MFYFPILVPLGVIGNILSFLVKVLINQLFLIIVKPIGMFPSENVITLNFFFKKLWLLALQGITFALIS